MINEEHNYSLLHRNTFGIDAEVARFIEYDSESELRDLLTSGRLANDSILHIGGGSNLLFLSPYSGTVLHSRIRFIEKIDETKDAVYLRVGAGVIWDDFVAYCVANNWYGAENLSIIPGEVGASAVQNIGAYGVEAKDLITEVHTMNTEGETKVFHHSDCRFGYRYSIFKEAENKNLIVTSVCFRLGKHEHYTLDYGTIRKELASYPTPSLQALREVIIHIRTSKLPDPAVMGNAGSFFMNPIVSAEFFRTLHAAYPAMPFYSVGEDKVKIPAAWLIEQSGWKGKTLGRAAVYEKQALVLINLGGATGKEVLALSDAIRKSVRKLFGIDIHPEVTMIGQ
jgi:UDP-N-acetylmuramate dehydrogenase